ncbi:MAG: 30S ribosomal protein S2, partial [Halomonas sp.]
DGVDYVIPGNDDSIRAIQIYVKAIADACNRAKEGRPDEFVEVTEEAASADTNAAAE